MEPHGKTSAQTAWRTVLASSGRHSKRAYATIAISGDIAENGVLITTPRRLDRGANEWRKSVSNRYVLSACLLASLAVTPAFAANTFQDTCSEIHFAYDGNNATIKAVCLRANGTANPTSLTLQGISNQNGKLTQGTGASTFQQSCGNIQILVNNGPNVSLSALCRTTSGSSVATSLSLNNISNNNGTLQQ
jgi:CVNH domain